MCRTFRYFLLIACFLLLAAASLASTQQNQAVEAALAFSAILDEQSFEAAYWSGSELLRQANDEQEWIDKTERSRDLLGNVLQRQLKVVRPVETYPGLPDDDYVIVYFEARTERKEKAAEVFLIHQVNGTLQVCSYSIH
jgi:Protein of unknown function (DUF4019)